MAAPSHVLAPRAVHRFRPPRFGLGGSRLGEPAGESTVDAAYQAGIRFFDTSPAYDGSEATLGTALARRPRGEFLVSTKVVGPDAEESVRGSADRLGVGVDLALVAEPTTIGPALASLDGLRRQGVIKAIGASSGDWQSLDHLVRDHELDCVLLTGQFSLFDQTARPLLDRCLARGVSVVVSGVLSAEVLHNDSVQARRVSAVCERYGVSLAQAALAFPVRHAAVASVLISAASPAEIRADAALVRQPVPATLWRDPELLRLLS